MTHAFIGLGLFLGPHPIGSHRYDQRSALKADGPTIMRFQSTELRTVVARERKLASGTEDRRLNSPCVNESPAWKESRA